jgi:hypothetical protein
VHTTGFDPTQVPAWHVFVCRHAFVPVHAVPLAFAGFEHWPVVGSQAPALWHWSEAVHVTDVPAHPPGLQTSLVVHAFPSSQGVPKAASGLVHVPVMGLHVPGV